MEREDIKMLVEKWWEIYSDETLDYKNSTKDIGSSGPLILQIPEAGGAHHYISAPSAA